MRARVAAAHAEQAFAERLVEVAWRQVRPEHVALLHHARSSRQGHKETGAPGLNPRGPFGGSDPYADIAAIVDGRTGDDYDEADERRHVQLFGEPALVLEIVLRSGSFEPGTYQRSASGRRQAASAATVS
ncbi:MULTISPECIES: hypothetical protein [unclassified Nonomuraea]|uniref:hypothetical protein n=1 Tax=unclassified Nonomuraea TaxID=2593643 RepID=UPI0033D2C950